MFCLCFFCIVFLINIILYHLFVYTIPYPVLAILTATGAKVSWKSVPLRWVKPWATRQALYLVISPLSPCLMRKTHLLPMAFLPLGSCANSKVLSLVRAAISSFMAWSH